MRNLRLWAVAAAVPALALLPATSASAHGGPRTDLRHGAVFVELNGGSGNSIAAYARHADGTLTSVGSFATGGLGGKQVGAPVDALASQGALALTDDGRAVVAVNAGSDSVSLLRIGDDELRLRSVVPSRGAFPSSVAVHGALAFVLNAGGDGSVAGFRIRGDHLVAIPGSRRTLGLGNDAVPFFLGSPSQVGVTPDGRTLVVATKSHNTLLSFPIRRDGTLGAAITTASQGPVPFSFVFDRAGRLEVTQAGDGRTATYAVRHDSTLVPLGVSAPSGGAALCWNVRVGRFLYGANAGSATLTSWSVARDGTTSVLAPVAATTAAGPIDLAASRGGRFVYALSAVAGEVDAWATHADGSLTPLPATTGLPTIDATGGPEGIVAT